MIRKILTSGAIVASVAVGVGNQVTAQSYPIDCAIILCLAGGWPASTECTSAKAEFIRRATPFPVEPPVQPWNCPMNAGTGFGQTDLSDPSFDFIRSVRVWDVVYSHRERGKDEDCGESGRVQLGEYDDRGEYSKSGQPFTSIPTWIVSDRSCRPRHSGGTRAVGLEWQSEEGVSGFEVIHY